MAAKLGITSYITTTKNLKKLKYYREIAIDSGIWKLGSSPRGFAIEELVNGGREVLGKNFPIVDFLDRDARKVISTKSMELLSDGYQDAKKVKSQLNKYLLNLEGLEKHRKWTKEGVLTWGGEELLLKLDEVGICASTGSACSSGSSMPPSHVLLAIGLEKGLAYSSLRVTIGEENTKEDIDFLISKLKEIISKLRK